MTNKEKQVEELEKERTCNDFKLKNNHSPRQCGSNGETLLLAITTFSIMMFFFTLGYGKWDYPMQRDVWGVLDRAQITAESGDMLKLVQEAKTNLENKRNLFGKNQIEGHCALIFKEPSNSLDAQYLALENIEKRLERTDTFDKNSVEYQTAIDDIRGTIRELHYLDCWIWRFD